jgi:hypothetical protein
MNSTFIAGSRPPSPRMTLCSTNAKSTRGATVTTNTVEGFFSILKRGLYGTYHAVSKVHLRYLAEFEFRYNGRKLNDGQRTLLAIQSAEGKRLVYRQPSGEAA